MANKTLHSLQFPGLSDVYVLPEQASEFSTSSTYAVGQYVTYRGILYKCVTAVSHAGSWTGATNWSATDVGTELRSIDSNHYTKTEEDSLLATKQNTLTFDNVPAFDSQNPVKSDGIFKSRVPMHGMGKNLIDNWYFGNPVNQRGESSYVAAANAYTIDRWYCNQPRGTVGITSSVIQLTKTATGSFQFTQKVNSFNAPCTFSVLLSTGSASGINIAIVDTNGSNLDIIAADAISGKQLVTCYYDGTGATPVDKVIIAMSSSVATNTSIMLYAVKLELGNQQTLCHNEGTSASPVWVLNEAQDYEYELYRCMTSTADSSDTYANQKVSTITIQCNSVSSSSLRYYNKLIQSTHTVLDSYFSNPAAKVSNITVTTSDGYLDFSNGFASGLTTNITLVLGTSGPALSTTTTASS